jgi:hypothetical protein
VIPLARDSLEEKMAERRMGQLSFADNLVADVVEASTTLDRILALVDWVEIATNNNRESITLLSTSESTRALRRRGRTRWLPQSSFFFIL